MPIVEQIQHIFEPTPLQCGQAAIAMLSGIDVNTVCEFCGTVCETDLKTMKRVLGQLGISMDAQRKQAFSIADLPNVALLSLETPRCWHWSVFFLGKIYDPEHGVLDDFPQSERRYFWELKDNFQK